MRTQSLSIIVISAFLIAATYSSSIGSVFAEIHVFCINTSKKTTECTTFDDEEGGKVISYYCTTRDGKTWRCDEMKARTGSVLDGSSLPPQLDAALDAAIEEESQNTREILKGSVSPDIGTRGGKGGLTLDPGTTNSNNDNKLESDGGILVENNTINSNIDTTNNTSVKTAIGGVMKLPGQEGTTGVGSNNTVVVEPPPKQPRPETIRLEIRIDSIQVFNDRDGSARGDGEWLLQGIITCCGGAANSDKPTKVYTFNAPGVTDGQIDTPDDRMNDVTGTYMGMWGTAETVNFKDVYQYVDIDNNNPLSELRINFFGIEDDKIKGSTTLPPIPDIPKTSADEAAKYLVKLIEYLNNLKSVDHLGTVSQVFKKSDNYGVGFHHAWSDRVYENKWFKTQSDENDCLSGLGGDCSFKDWPDFPEYQINYRIIDRDQRCVPGSTYDYIDNICRSVQIN